MKPLHECQEILDSHHKLWVDQVKKLIATYNITQEELYPWVEISPDSMPKEGQEVIVGWLDENGKVVDFAKTVHEILCTSWIDSYFEEHSEWFGADFDTPPTHWLPIPQIR